MGELTNFTVNDDGSVTVVNEPARPRGTNRYEANILDIFRIEKAKGGPFASRRMKKRALKYAKEADVPEHIVEKLMLDNYPNEFACYPKTTVLIVWLSIIVLFVLGTIILAFPTYWEYDRYSWATEDYEAFLNRREEKNVAYADGADEYFSNMSFDTYNKELNYRLERKKDRLSDFLFLIYADLACIAIISIGIWQYRTVRKSIIETAAGKNREW